MCSGDPILSSKESYNSYLGTYNSNHPFVIKTKINTHLRDTNILEISAICYINTNNDHPRLNFVFDGPQQVITVTI